MDKILVLGASGFVGTNVCNMLKECGINYKATSLSAGVDLKDIKQTADLLRDICPSIILNFAANVGGLNYVISKAAEVVSDNAKMILSLYENVADICPGAVIINPIGSCTYPGHLDIFAEKNWHDGNVHDSVLSYGSARRFTYAISECYKLQFGLKTVSLIVNNMYGPYESTDPNKAHALSALVAKFVKAKMVCQDIIEVWGTGKPVREWLFVKDFSRIILKIIRDPDKYTNKKPFNIAQQYGVSVRDLVSIIQKEVTYKGLINYNASKPDGAPIKIMDKNRFTKMFPDFTFTPLSEGIRETIDYYKKIYPY